MGEALLGKRILGVLVIFLDYRKWKGWSPLHFVSRTIPGGLCSNAGARTLRWNLVWCLKRNTTKTVKGNLTFEEPLKKLVNETASPGKGKKERYRIAVFKYLDRSGWRRIERLVLLWKSYHLARIMEIGVSLIEELSRSYSV